MEASADLMAFKRVTMLRITWVFCSEMKMLQVLAEGLEGRDEIRRKKYSEKRDICELTGSSVWSPLLLLATYKEYFRHAVCFIILCENISNICKRIICLLLCSRSACVILCRRGIC